jgi:adenylate cyclase class 2
MAVSMEVEIKFLIEDLRALERLLRSAGFRRITPRTHELNTLYDTPRQTLRQRGELLRIRKYGRRWILTHKGKGANTRHKIRIETETELANGEKMAAILDALGFVPSFRYEKFRSEWTDGRGHVVLDETPIGNVSEIEGKPRWIDATAKKLGVSRAQYITQNYASMFFDWKARTGSAAKEMTFKAVGQKAVPSRKPRSKGRK